MKKEELKNKNKQQIIDYIYMNNIDKIWSVLYEDFINNESDFADVYILDPSKYKIYVSIVQIDTVEKSKSDGGNNYIEYFATFKEAQKWAIETLQAKANLKP